MYCKRFPELEHQVFNPLDYARVVRKLGNNLTKINELNDILPASNIITISMTASSTSGKNLSDEDLNKVFEACDFVLDLDESRQKVFCFTRKVMSSDDEQ
jgi:U4/U6 small nuclear ribonucleoprotein PRP31